MSSRSSQEERSQCPLLGTSHHPSIGLYNILQVRSWSSFITVTRSATDPPGTQLFVALFDSFGTSLGVLPVVYTVTRESTHPHPHPSLATHLTSHSTHFAAGSTDCLTKSESHGVQEVIQPEISSSVFGRLLPCGCWEMSFSGGKPPYSVSIVALKSRSVYNYSVPSGEHVLSYTSRGELSGQVVGKFSC